MGCQFHLYLPSLIAEDIAKDASNTMPNIANIQWSANFWAIMPPIGAATEPMPKPEKKKTP
jgi:hypothetical protein